MIPKLSSSELNGVLEDATDNIKQVESNITSIENDIVKKFSVVTNEQEFSLNKMSAIKNLLTNASVADYSDKIVFSNTNNLQGVYDLFGSCVHPKLSTTPVNVFNFTTESGPFYKDNAVIKINDAISTEAKEFLKHDSIANKGIFFNEYDSSTLTIEITVDTGKLVGETKSNMIEIVPFIAGSFKINDISILTNEDNLMGTTLATSVMSDIDEVGYVRLILDKIYNVYKIVFTIELLYKNINEKYPFGLRHMYFYNASFTANSYIVTQINKNKYIDSVSDDLILTTQTDKEDISATAKDIELYLNCSDDGTLTNELDISTSAITSSWARDTKSFYVKVPLDTSILALQFKNINTR